jgi:hypothetical protein
MLLYGIIADRHLSLFAANDIIATSHRWLVLRGAQESQFNSSDPKST